jgi:hypothetical protein
MAITSLPTPPTRGDPANFAQRGDAFMAALPTFATQANTLQADVTAKQATASAAANAAGTSKDAAAGSASASAASAAASEVSAAAATTQAATATTRANTSTTRASEASASAATAATQATTATNQAAIATSKASEAAGSRDAASGSATAAANSAAASLASSNTSTASKNAAATSETNAASSASSAATSKSGSDTALASAVAAKNAAETALDSFDDRYLGSKSVAPTLDNDGAAILTGALYWDSVLNGGCLRVRQAGAWVTIPANVATEITTTPAGTLAATNVQAALNELDSKKATVNSPVFSGTPTAPTAAFGISTEQVATTEFVSDNTMALRAIIGSGVDLNDITVSGIYPQNSSPNAANGINYPTSVAGMLEVFSNGSMTYQRYTSYGTGSRIFERCRYNTTWPAWVALATTQDTISATNPLITFPAAQNLSADPNTLDDYEEGSFTPVVWGSSNYGVGTYSAQVGRYTKIGNRVFFSISLAWTAHNGTGSMRIGGLPFLTSVQSGFTAVTLGLVGNLTYTAGTTPKAYISAGSSYVVLIEISTGVLQNNIAMDSFVNYLTVSGQYEV